MLQMSRRAMITGAAALGAGGAVGGAAKAAAQPFFKRTGLPLGLQLYTLGPDLAADPQGMLRQVAAAGYRTVELAGLAGQLAPAFRALLDMAGLAATSSHVGAASSKLQAGLDNIDGVIAEAKVMGVRHIVLPSSPTPERIRPAEGEDRRAFLAGLAGRLTAEDWKATAALLNAKVGPLKAAGLTLGYHNHNIELAPVGGAGGATGLEILLKAVDPAVQFEMDAGWVVAGGGDPFAILKAHPGRFRQMHVKDLKASTKTNFAFQMDPVEVGAGVIDWTRLLPAAHTAGVDGFFVEQEAPYTRPRIEAARIDAAYLLKV
jgi:sugar phosphate isomerase/epimerase